MSSSGAQPPFPGMFAELGIRQDLVFEDFVPSPPRKARVPFLGRRQLQGPQPHWRGRLAQILHPFTGSAQSCAEEVSTPTVIGPVIAPQVRALQPVIADGFDSR